LRGGVLLLLVPVFRIRGALRCQTSPRAHSCHRGYDSGPHARRASQLEATKRTLSLSLTLALARPATIPRARVAETEAKAKSYHYHSHFRRRARPPGGGPMSPLPAKIGSPVRNKLSVPGLTATYA
jgi:hypothetical protein